MPDITARIKALPFLLFLALLVGSCKLSEADLTSKLHHSILKGKLIKAGKYIQKGAAVNYRETQRGWTPLILSAQQGHANIVALLLENGADPNLVSSQDEVSALERAASNGHLEVVRLLINHGADVNHQNKSLRATALMFASANGHVDVVQFLVENNARIDVRGNRGESALFLSVSSEQIEVVKLLLSHGANKERPDIYGVTCLEKAEKLNNQEIIKLLQDEN